MKRAMVLVLMMSGCAPEPEPLQVPLLTEGERIVLLFHGAGDDESPAVWADSMADAMREAWSSRSIEGWQVIAYDWSARSDNRTTAYGNAEAEGDAIAMRLLDGDGSHAHLIGHSAGTPMAARVAKRLAESGAAMTTHVTMLDPFGLFGPASCAEATFCEAWRNTDDGVPGSDGDVDSAFNVDVTAAKPDDARGHWWPTEAYHSTIESWASPGFGLSVENDIPVATMHDDQPRGSDIIWSQ